MIFCMNARKLLEVKTLSQTVCNITKNEATNNTLKVLYFVDEYVSVSPQILISKLGIVKSNLALLTRKMINDGLIESKHSLNDKRAITYSITPKGKQMLTSYLEKLEKIFHEQDNDIEQSLDIVLRYLNKKV